MATAVAQLQTQTQSLLQTLPLECPFAWKSQSYLTKKQIQFFPENSKPTISFTATRNSKIMGYLPIKGTSIGISRIKEGIREHQHFKNIHLHSLSNRSLNWIARGALECIPVLGGIACMIIDLFATLLSKIDLSIPVKLEDETDCGLCHKCGYCKC